MRVLRLAAEEARFLPLHFWWFIPAINADDWGMVYYCFNRTNGNGMYWNVVLFWNRDMEGWNISGLAAFEHALRGIAPQIAVRMWCGMLRAVACENILSTEDTTGNTPQKRFMFSTFDNAAVELSALSAFNI